MVDCPGDNPKLNYSFFMDPSEMSQNIGHTAAVLYWNDGAYLGDMHNAIDIEAGMLVYHKYPLNDSADDDNSCYLNCGFRKLFANQ